MSKYITKFETEAAYQTALPSLDLPNVSLVTQTNEVHYHRLSWGGVAGDILVYDVQEAQKLLVKYADWNLTSYPTASYPIIGIVVADESAAGLTVMSNFGLAADGSKTTDTDTSRLKWQNIQTMDWGLTKYTSGVDAKTDFNGKANTTAIINAIKAYDTANNTDNITGNIGGAIQAFVTEGTVAGDWYVGSEGELYKVYENKTAIKAAADKIYNANSTLGMNGNTLLSNTYFWSSSEASRFDAWKTYMFDGNVSQYTKNESYRVNALLRV